MSISVQNTDLLLPTSIPLKYLPNVLKNVNDFQQISDNWCNLLSSADCLERRYTRKSNTDIVFARMRSR